MSRLATSQARSHLFRAVYHPRYYSSAMQPRFSPGTNEAAVTSALGPLLASSGGRWTLAADGEALERNFKFKTFAKTWVC